MKQTSSPFWLNLETKISAHPLKIIIAVLIISLFFLYFLLTNTKINNDTETFIPESNPVKIFFNKTNDTFGASAGIIIALENPAGLYTQESLAKIQELTRKLEVLDNKIAQKQLTARLKGFNPEEVETFQAFLNENLALYQNADEFKEALRDTNTLDEYFSDPDTRAKVGTLPDKTLKDIYQLQTRFLDKNDKWQKRVRKVISLTNVDYVYSELTDTSSLNNFFSSATLSPSKGKLLSEFFLDKALLDVKALGQWFASPQAAEALNNLGLELPQIEKLRRLSPVELSAWLTALKKAPKQIKVGDLVNFEAIGANPQQELFLVKERLRNWEMYENLLYSQKNPRATLISIEMVPQLTKEEREILIENVYQEVTDSLKDSPMLAHIAGEPVVTEVMGKNMVRDMSTLFPLVLLVILSFLYLSFRHWRGVFLPLITVVLTTIWTLGTIALLDASISLVSTILPVLMVAVGSAYGIHIIHHYFEDRALGFPRGEALKKTLSGVGLAVIMAGLTTIAGFGSLTSNNVIPIKEFGLFAALGILYALLISLVFIPALLRVGKLPKKIAELKPSSEEFFEEAHGRLGRFLEMLGHWTLRRHGIFLLLFGLALVFAFFGISRLNVEINLIDQFKQDTEIRRSDTYIRSNFAGTSTFDVVLDTGAPLGTLSYRFLLEVNAFQEEIKKHPMVGKATSAVDAIKKMHQSMNYSDPAFYQIPQSAFDAQGKEISFANEDEKQAALAKVMNSYLDMFDQDDNRRILDNQKQLLKINIILKSGSTIATSDLVDFVKQKSRAHFSAYLKDFDSQLGFAGVNPLTVEINDLLVHGQIWSILLSALIVILLVAFMQKSLLIGLISIIPLGLAILINFGMMGFLGISLDVGTAIISNIAIGIGVDYTIHYLNGYLSLIKKGENKKQATLHTTIRSGEAILINAFSVAAGFAVLCFSSFLPIISTGWLIALTMLTTSFSALTFIPVILNRLKLKSV